MYLWDHTKNKDQSSYSQKLARRGLQTHHKVEDVGEYHDCDEGDWNVNDRKSRSFDKRMIHGNFSMLNHNGPLCEEGRNLSN
jgi:hypothetical protein